jgi:hypothetical protein
MTEEMNKRHNNGKPPGLLRRVLGFGFLCISIPLLFIFTIVGFFIKKSMKTFSRGGK